MPKDDFDDGLPTDWAAMETHVDADGNFRPPLKRVAKGPDAKTVKFPCQACFGSGLWQRRPGHKCFACKGSGYFMTSERERSQSRENARSRKVRQLAEDRKFFDETYPGVGEFLATATWSPFAQDLLAKLNQYGSLSERQVYAINSMRAKSEERRAGWNAERAANAQVVDLSPIRAMFESAVASGHKSPIYRAAGLVISRAPDHGRNPGALYIYDDEREYLGKIVDCQYTGKAAPALTAIAADPRGEAVAYGRKTGRCSCCGRTLTDPNSVALGIGPICADKWGL